jgi:hypothetical protein
VPEAVAGGFGAFIAGVLGHEVVVDLEREVLVREVEGVKQYEQDRWYRSEDGVEHNCSRTFGFSLRHWKAWVRSSVSRAVKLMGCLGAAMLLFWRVCMVEMMGLYDWNGVWRFGCLSGKKASGGGKRFGEVKSAASGQNSFHMHANGPETRMTD